MVQHNLLPPTFESDRRPDQFVATFLFHHFLGADDLAWLRSLTTEPFSDEEARALVFVREVGAIDYIKKPFDIDKLKSRIKEILVQIEK